jgi:hypothetical protein
MEIAVTSWKVFDAKILIKKDLSGTEILFISCVQIQKACEEM